MLYFKIYRWTDQIKSTGKNGGAERNFNHPFVQACVMFLGEFMCLVVFKIIFCQLRLRNVSVFNFDDISKIKLIIQPKRMEVKISMH
jgi:hypothetical protein